MLERRARLVGRANGPHAAGRLQQAAVAPHAPALVARAAAKCGRLQPLLRQAGSDIFRAMQAGKVTAGDFPGAVAEHAPRGIRPHCNAPARIGLEHGAVFHRVEQAPVPCRQRDAGIVHPGAVRLADG